MNDECDSPRSDGSTLAASAKSEPEQRISVDIVREDNSWEADRTLDRLVERLAGLVVAQIEPAIGRPQGVDKVGRSVEVALALSFDERVRTLNRDFRGKDSATNVLSFPSTGLTADLAASVAKGQESGAREFIGDIIIARETMLKEANNRGVAPLDHFAHLVVHGLLHLFGYDHETDEDAVQMEAHETAILAKLGIADPYNEEETQGSLG